MQQFLPCVVGSIVLAFSALPTLALADNQTQDCRLTVELRDGSRIVGRSQDAAFQFHSAVLGDLDLPLGKIRSVESLSRTNLVKLTTTGDDLLTVVFATPEIRVETTYGNIKLPVAMIKTVRVLSFSSTGRPTEGLIGLWSAEGNGFDAVAENNGTLCNVTFTEGVTGQAFSFAPDNFPYGTYTGIQIPDRPAYVLTEALTIEGWVRPRGNGYIILCRGDHRPGMDPYTVSMQANHTLRFQICRSETETAYVDTMLPYGQWTHVAAVFDGDSGTIGLATNGVLAVQQETHVRPLGALLPQMSPGLGIGNLNDGGNNFPFNGDIDELALYNRALSGEEIKAIWAEKAANAGGRAGLFPPRNSPSIKMRRQFSGFNSD